MHSPYSTANGAAAANRPSRPADSDSIVISDSDDDSQSLPPAPKGSVDQGHEEGLMFTYTHHFVHTHRSHMKFDLWLPGRDDV